MYPFMDCPYGQRSIFRKALDFKEMILLFPSSSAKPLKLGLMHHHVFSGEMKKRVNRTGHLL